MPSLVLLHGLGRTRRSMLPLARDARRRGWQVLNLGYPSRRHGIRALAAHVAAAVAEFAPGEPLHFVTHSLGGILVRAAVAEGLLPLSRVARVVMLAPPNAGSEVVDRLVGLRIFHLACGPAGCELGTGEGSVPCRLPPAPFEVGIIAGTRSANPIFSRVIAGANDGTVGVARTRLEGMRDWLEVPHTHTFLMRAPAVRRQALHFLEHGRFDAAAGERR